MKKEYLCPALAAALAFVALVPFMPSVHAIPFRDSGVFQYIGWRMLNGEVPYRDVWDHKPPLIFFVNALGLALGGGSRWGVWAIELASLVGANLIAFYLMRKAWGPFPALFGTCCAALATVVVFDGGNMTEEYALPLNFALLALYRKSETEGQRPGLVMAMGALTAAAFLLKLNMIGVGFSVCLCLAIGRIRAGRWRDLGSGIFFFALGAIIVLGACVAYFAHNDALQDLWETAIVYNFAYAEVTWTERIASARQGLRLMLRAGILAPAALGFVAACISLVRRSRLKDYQLDPLLPVLLLNLPVEIFLSSTTGRSYPHYYFAWIPALALLSAYFVSVLLQRSENGESLIPTLTSSRIRAICVGILCVFALYPARHWVNWIVKAREHHKGDLTQNELVVFLKQNTREEESFLMWGAEASMNLTLRRRAPTRFVYQYALFAPYHPDTGVLDVFLTDLEDDPPKYIVDASLGNKKVPPLDTKRYRDWKGHRDHPPLREGFDEVRDTILERYERVDSKVGRRGAWDIYALRGQPPE